MVSSVRRHRHEGVHVTQPGVRSLFEVSGPGLSLHYVGDVGESTAAGGSGSRSTSLGSLLTPRFALVAALSSVVVGLLAAIPTAIIANPWFTRMTPIYANQYFFWMTTSVAAGALIASYFAGAPPSRSGGGIGGGLLGYLAVGCPICNKLIVGLLGASGAMSYFAPIQPLLGALGLMLVCLALAYRMRDLRRGSCPVPTAR